MTISKQSNLFKLYKQLPKNGARRDFQRVMAKDAEVSISTVKGHWFYEEQIPNYITGEQLDKWITYLQNTIASNNKVSVG